MNYFGSIFAMVACIVMSAYFSATETAFSSLNKTRLKVLADNGNKRAALALKLSEDYDKLISTILIGNNIVNIMVASIGTRLFVGLYGDIGATVSTVVVTIVVLIFGEITPKSVAKDAPERFALFSAPFIRLWIWVLTPLNFLFSRWKSWLPASSRQMTMQKCPTRSCFFLWRTWSRMAALTKTRASCCAMLLSSAT